MKTKYILCQNCNRTFILSEKEQNVLTANGKPLPTLCSTCAKERRDQKQTHQKEVFTEEDFRFWKALMKDRIPVRRDTKHPTDDFRGFTKNIAS